MIKKIVLFVIYLSVAIVGGLIAVKNSHLIEFNYYFATLEMPLVVALFAAFMLGALITMLVCYISIFSRNRQIKRLDRSKKAVEKELTKLQQNQQEKTES